MSSPVTSYFSIVDMKGQNPNHQPAKLPSLENKRLLKNPMHPIYFPLLVFLPHLEFAVDLQPGNTVRNAFSAQPLCSAVLVVPRDLI